MILPLFLALVPMFAALPSAASNPELSLNQGLRLAGPEVDWIAFGEAMETNLGGKKKHQRPLLVDFYTDWCGWCKRQDATTFRDPRIVNYLNEHFHAVQFDAEGNAPVEFRGETLQRQGKTHQLALQLASQRGRIGYPTIVLLSPEGDTWAVLQGYQTADKLLPQLVYYAEGYHEDLDFATFKGLYQMPDAP
jgi:thioredoxin-related protein